jgi:hypothetical protein
MMSDERSKVPLQKQSNGNVRLLVPRMNADASTTGRKTHSHAASVPPRTARENDDDPEPTAA